MRAMRWSLPLSLALGFACTDFLPAVPDVASDVTNTPGDEVADADADDAEALPDIGVTACETVFDCAHLAQCCLDVACEAGVCMPRYVPSCCTIAGPCAVSTPQHTGTCEATCIAQGCVASLALGGDRCDETIWQLDPSTERELAIFDAVVDRVTWHRSRLRPFAGEPSWRAGDVLCPSYHTGLTAASCAPPEADGGAVDVAFETPAIALPADAPALVEVWLFADLPESDGLTTPLDGLTLELITASGGWLTLWSTRTQPVALGAWTPVLVDVSRWAGQEVHLRFRFDTLDGRDNHHEGVSLGRLRVRTACTADRAAADRSRCEVASLTAVQGVSDAIAVFAPPDPGRACQLCASDAACPRSDTCDVARCADGICVTERELTPTCCTPDARWPGDGSFEGPLDAALEGEHDGWSVGPGWSVSGLRSLAGESALHFGLPDGSGLAPPGERAEGAILSPVVRVHEDAPRWAFSVWLSTEWDLAPSGDNPAGLDLLEAIVLPEVPVALAPFAVWDSRALGGTTAGDWVEVVIDLTPFRGHDVRLGWRFSTGDADNNAHEGAYLDQVTVHRACPGCDPEALEPGEPSCEPTTSP